MVSKGEDGMLGEGIDEAKGKPEMDVGGTFT